MGVEYTNRKGERYLLQVGRTKTGKARYWFGRKLTGAAVEGVPEGYEIHESPESGQVFLRKVRATQISPMERETLCEIIRREAGLEYFAVDVEKDSLVVFVPAMDVELARGIIQMFGGESALGSSRMPAVMDAIMGKTHYHKAMRFLLVNAEKRTFVVQRWCSRGSIDDWIFLFAGGPLAELASRYVPHLGKESFYGLM